MRSCDVCIVGAGVVGCAIAREFAHRHFDTSHRIVVLDTHEKVGEETSGRNRCILHSGIHERPGLSAALAIARHIVTLPSIERRWSPYGDGTPPLTTPESVDGAVALVLPCARPCTASFRGAFEATRRGTRSLWGLCTGPGIADSAPRAALQTRLSPLARQTP